MYTPAATTIYQNTLQGHGSYYKVKFKNIFPKICIIKICFKFVADSAGGTAKMVTSKPGKKIREIKMGGKYKYYTIELDLK